MNFVKSLEEQLRDLSITSRRRNAPTHPAIKEAAERAILSLRSLQNAYVVAVRQASRSSGSIKHPTTSLFKSQDVLRPFLLAMNYRDCGNNMINLSLDGVQQLLRGDAVCSDDGVNIVRVLNIQASLCAASIEKNCNHSTVMGITGINGGMVSAGVGAVSNFGNSLLSGFGILGNGHNNAGRDAEQEVKHSAVTPHAHSSNRSLKEDTAISIRILQTLVMIIGSESLILTEEVLSSCISICLLLGFLENEECVNLGMRSGSNLSGNVGGGGSKRKDFQEHNSSNLNSSEGGAQGSLKKVSRVAIATLRQIVSTVFDRAGATRGVSKPTPQRIAENEESNWGPDTLHVQEVASRLLEDLCEITGSSAIHAIETSELQKRCSGPFGQAMVGQQHRILPPPMSICFDLIEMIVEQQVELFVDNRIGTFLSIMRDRLCPIIIRRLSFGSNGTTMDTGSVVFTSNNHDRTVTLALKLTSLTLTIINSYGLKEQLRAECRDLLISLTKLVDSATDVLRDSHEFEDGYVYNCSSKDESLQDQSKPHLSGESSQTLWGASIAIEFIYTLFSDNFHKLLPLLATMCQGVKSSDGEGSCPLLSIIVGSICDFAVVASSCKKAISKVVEASDNTINDNDDPNITFPRNIEVKDHDNVFVCQFDFSVRKIHPTIVSNAREMQEYDIGSTVWVALNCILILWDRLHTTDKGDKSVQFGVMDHMSQKVLIDGCFASSLASIKHFLRRCPASERICQAALSGYLLLARCVLPVCKDGDIQRQVVLTSLCKLALPSKDEVDLCEPNSLNVMAIALLFQLLHFNANDIGTGWPVFFTCLNRLSCIPAKKGTPEESSIASNISSIGYLSKRLDPGSLAWFTSSLIQFDDSSERAQEEETGSTYALCGDELYRCTREKLELTKLSTTNEQFRRLPLSLVLLVDVSIENSHRFLHFGKKTMDHFSGQAASSDRAEIRIFSSDVLSYFVIAHLSQDNGNMDENRVNSRELLQPLCKCISDTNRVDTAELGLKKMKSILEDGYDVSSAWLTIIHALSTIAIGKTMNINWGNCCAIAFGCLKLIVDDFLNEVPSQEEIRIALLDCCTSFGSSRYDVNTSLTAIGMIWTIADRDSSPSAVDHVLSKLAFLACDDRVEVRNCVVNTLFSCVVGLGQKFTALQWERVFNQTIFAILDRVSERNDSNEESKRDRVPDKNSDRYKVSVHHSRDSVSKQWVTTQVLTLRGIERVLRLYFDKLLNSARENTETSDWFQRAWDRIVALCFSCSTLLGGRETLDLRLVGVDLMILCCQASSQKGFIASDARVSTNMQVVNGALRSVRPSTTNPNLQVKSEEVECDPLLVDHRRNLFDKSFEELMNFKNFLEENRENLNDGDEVATGYIETTHLQVLTKFSQGLSKLYECCRDEELSPRCSSNCKESEFVELVAFIAEAATGGPSSKYLTQAQKPCLDLLKNMSLNCSSLAFEVLVRHGSNSVFGQRIQDNHDVGVLDTEASKLISEICTDQSVAIEVKRSVAGLTATIYLPGGLDLLDNKEAENKDEDNDVESEVDEVASLKTPATEETCSELDPNNFNGDNVVDVADGDICESDDEECAKKLFDRQSGVGISNTEKVASTENCELREINLALMRQVELLKSEKERLEQQVAVLSEGSAYL